MPDLLQGDTAIAFARVAVERSIDRYPNGLTYGIPPDLEDLQPGDRVIVPLGRGNRNTMGFIIEIGNEPGIADHRLKMILSRDKAHTRIPLGIIELGRWISEYYCASIGMTLSAMVPAPVKKNTGVLTRTYVDLPLTQPTPGGRNTPAGRKILAALESLDQHQRPIDIRKLQSMAEVSSPAPIKRLARRNEVVLTMRSTIEAQWFDRQVEDFVPGALTPEQQDAIDAIGPLLSTGFSSHLLFGVTGSGKTEVYIRLIQEVIDAGRTALMLVPEISLTPQTWGRLAGRFPDQHVAILHSGLTAAQRNQQWALVAKGESRIVLGARSAIFAPIADDNLGLIIVDEEHDGSYKQDQSPRYNGRDVAIRRAQLSGCPVILGSATPSIESWYNATERGITTLHRLPKRVPGMHLPKIQIVDFCEERRARTDNRVHLIGPRLESALGRTLAEGWQALLLLNRRGYANYIACPNRACGWVMQCEDCDATTVFHRNRELPRGGFVRCHHCETETRLPRSCPRCDRSVSTFGLGTQRVEEELERKFPALVSGTSMVRVDSDSIRGGRDLHLILDQFGRGDIRVLVGTQMIAKGLDYPNVRLVGVINADTAANLPDFRACERTFQLVSQVAGRCGRTSDPRGLGEVIVQTFQPTMAAIRHAADHDYEAFAAAELETRRHCTLPPVSRMARMMTRHHDETTAATSARTIAECLRFLAGNDETVRVRGPSPCPIARIAGRWRYQVEVFAGDAASLQHLIAEARDRGVLTTGSDLVVDVDPLALL